MSELLEANDEVPDLQAADLEGVGQVSHLTKDLPFEGNPQPAEESRGQRLHRLRHSTAHLMAEAVVSLFPTAKVATGPSIEHGFYYDFELPRPLTPDDLIEIERRMKKVAKRGTPFQKAQVTIDQARELFEKTGQSYKLEVIDRIVETQKPETVTLYRASSWTCARGRTSRRPAG
jgi:threonyl-tRNA synthetase